MRETPSLTVRQIDPLSRTNWNHLLGNFPHANTFHTAEWCAVLRDTYDYKPCYVCGEEQGDLVSVLPLMEVSSPITGLRGISLPFTDECEPLGGADRSPGETLESAIQFGRARRWRYLEIRGGDGIQNQSRNASPSVSFFTHRLRLMPDIENLFDQFDPAVRRAIRRAEKSGLAVEYSTDLPALDAYYDLHCKTRRMHGLPPQPLKFFRNIQNLLLARGHGIIVSAKHQDTVIASAIFLRHGREAIYKFGAADPDSRHLRGNNLVMWAGIRWCVEKGAEFLNFGRTSLSNEGLRRFKLGWGSDEKRLSYYKYDLRNDCFIKDKDATSGWHTALFRAMPLFANRWAGSFLYRHVA